MTPDCKVSIIVLGDVGVGKTSLLHRYTKNAFKAFYPATMIDCLHKVIKLKDKEVKLDLWDTAGQDRYRAITKQYYRLADGVLLIYDVTDVVTFHKLSGWLDELRNTNTHAVVVIVGNKNDDESRKSVSVTQVKSYAEQEGIDFVETSAKSGEGVDMIFDSLVTKILQARDVFPQSLSSQQTSLSENTSQATSSAGAEDYQPTDANTNSTSTVKSVTDDEDELGSFEYVSASDINLRTAVCESSRSNQDADALPPIIPTPSDCIRLHVNTRKETKEKKKCACA